MTVNDFITDVLRQLTVISEIDTPSAEQGQDAVTKLNELMASLAEDEIKLGYNPKATTAEDIVLPDGQVSTIKAMLGVRLAEGYGLPVPQIMAAFAESGYKRLLRQSLNASMRPTKPDCPTAFGGSYNILTDSR
jgi:hypothetical protein